MPDTADILDRLEAVATRLERAAPRTPEFCTVSAAARLLGMGTKALRRAIYLGEVSVYHLGSEKRGRQRVHIEEVRYWAFGTRYDRFGQARVSGSAAAREACARRSGS